MTLLLREVGSFLVAGALWVGIEAGIAAIVMLALESRISLARPHAFGIGFAGALVAASLAVRFSAPLALALEIGTRPLPIVWSTGGAVIASVAALAVGRRRSPAAP